MRATHLARSVPCQPSLDAVRTRRSPWAHHSPIRTLAGSRRAPRPRNRATGRWRAKTPPAPAAAPQPRKAWVVAQLGHAGLEEQRGAVAVGGPMMSVLAPTGPRRVPSAARKGLVDQAPDARHRRGAPTSHAAGDRHVRLETRCARPPMCSGVGVRASRGRRGMVSWNSRRRARGRRRREQAVDRRPILQEGMGPQQARDRKSSCRGMRATRSSYTGYRLGDLPRGHAGQRHQVGRHRIEHVQAVDSFGPRRGSHAGGRSGAAAS